MSRIAFSAPYRAGLEDSYVAEALASPTWQGDGPFTKRASQWLAQQTGAPHTLLTTSCTHALELAAILLQLGPGDEVIVPSFTFSSTATAIAIRGARPVFVDVEPETLNIDPAAVEAAITPFTRAIFVVHYAGISANMPELQRIAAEHDLRIVEDNAHSIGAYVDGRHLGTFGELATQSWHATKNIASGEGGSLIINDPSYYERAEIIREKGTNRSRFLRGAVDKYTWIDQGSSYLPSEILAALLVAQMERFDQIQELRHRAWNHYEQNLGDWAGANGVRPMVVPENVQQPAHMYYLMMPSADDQGGLIQHLADRDIVATFHYQPLDSAEAGRRFGFTPSPCPVTADAAHRLVRLPLHAGLGQDDLDQVVEAVTEYRPTGA